ncbi:(S)-N-methylcoclaurine 3'-hydroxylase-like protein [Salvia hispanica]|uniref:(S)-N-methylcoclaurine 3'-hydroxylase-like protein n=1 Tax=Salvia hispanica TaxID=49212 RepID=UPI002009822A|nr:(S)-N-methylcoclaurine 3'-hydroxylase-like protein [Salvia hispanica]
MVMADGINLLIIILLITILLFFLIKKSEAPPLPPGPNPWPIIGTINHLLTHKPFHISLANLAQTHGPLMHIKLGTQHLIVGSSPAAAAEILKANDRHLSGRFVPHVVPRTPAQIHTMSFWADSTSPHRKSLRALCRAELFAAAALERSGRAREEKAAELVAELRLKRGVVNVEEMVLATVVNMFSNVYFSRDLVVGFGENPMADVLKGIGEAFDAKDLSDLYPFFRVLDPRGLRRKYMECSKRMWGIWEPIVKERRVSELKHGDFLDTLISRGFGDDQINHLLEDLFSGGIHTTSLTIIKTITELLTSPHSIAKFRQELDAAFDGQDSLTTMTSEIDNLPYLQACIKETLRLHPPAPLMLTHRAYAACLVMNYTVPCGAQVLINVWAIGRDPAVWEDPLHYRPERFLGSSIEFKGNNFEFLPFGAGRRICPGISMASKIIALVVATLVYFFDWSAPVTNGPLLITPRARK